ncbi:hypothetical protein [Endozoicomonas ascidiicola]|nr:hypothetical protein [Endozoicomonas ascidiicola]
MQKIIGITFCCFLIAACEFWDVDKCLDRGGKWDYDKEQCDFGDKE